MTFSKLGEDFPYNRNYFPKYSSRLHLLWRGRGGGGGGGGGGAGVGGIQVAEEERLGSRIPKVVGTRRLTAPGSPRMEPGDI